MNGLYSFAMLRRLVAIFALITGLTALAAPAQAVAIPLGKSSEIAASAADTALFAADSRCDAEQSKGAATKPRKSKGKAVTKRIIVVPPIHTGIDFAHE